MRQRTEPRESKDISTQAAAALKYVTTCQRGRNRSSLGSGRGWGGILWLLKPCRGWPGEKGTNKEAEPKLNVKNTSPTVLVRLNIGAKIN